MDEQNSSENLAQEVAQLRLEVNETNLEQAHWKALALETQQLLLVERQARSEAETALHKASFLARASAFVTGAFDYSANLNRLVRLVIDQFADWSAVDLLTTEGELKRVTVASKNAGHEELLRDSYAYFPLNLDGPHPVAQVLRDKKSLLVRDSGLIPLDAGLNLAASDPSTPPPLSPANQSYIVIPISVGDEILGAFIFVRLTANPAFDEADLALAEDLSSKVALMIQNSRLYDRLEKALENQQELNYYKDLYLSILSHELRNPLASIRGYSEVLLRNLTSRQTASLAANPVEDTTDTLALKKPKSGAEFEKEFRALNILINQSDRMTYMVNELLDFSRIQKNSFELNYLTTVDLTDLLERIVEQQSMVVKTHYFELVTDRPEIKGIFDENRLEQVFNNLISNAVKYSPGGTTVKIRLRLQPAETLLENAPSYALIAVQDQGQGIAKEAQAQLFDRYYRVRTEKNRVVQGLGLGLYICKEIIRQHHGELWVKSELEVGSTFYVSLPLQPPPTAPNLLGNSKN